MCLLPDRGYAPVIGEQGPRSKANYRIEEQERPMSIAKVPRAGKGVRWRDIRPHPRVLPKMPDDRRPHYLVAQVESEVSKRQRRPIARHALGYGAGGRRH